MREGQPRLLWIVPLKRTQSHKLPNLTINMGGKTTDNAMIDSGASKSVITKAEAYNLWGSRLKSMLKPWKDNMLGANNERIKVIGLIKVRIKVGQIDTYWELVVIDSRSREILLGRDFMRENRLTLIEDKFIARLEMNPEAG